MDRRFRPRPFDDEGTLFRSLVVILVPLCVGGGVATRAYAEPPALHLEAATELARGIRNPLPPRVWIQGPRLVDTTPETGPGTARPLPTRRAPSPRPGDHLARTLATMGHADATLFSPDYEEEMARAVAGVGSDLASRSDEGVRRAHTSRDGDLATGILDSEEGVVDVGGGREPAVGPPSRWRLAPEQAPRADQAELVGSVGRGARGRVESCVQSASRLDPDVHGRVELAWEVDGGRPGDVVVKENRTGNAELAQCLRRAVLALDFGESTRATVSGYAWVVQAVD